MRHGPSKFKVGAPAAMILAAAVTTAVSSDTVIAPAQANLPWAVEAGTPITARSARAFIARQAANKIRDLDRLSGAAPVKLAALDLAPQSTESTVEVVQFACIDQSAGTHQHAAP